MKKEDRAMLREEFAKAFDSKNMIDYCADKAASFAVLPDGKIIVVDKQKIEKDFCFGESGYDYDEAHEQAEHARKSKEYFKQQNMKLFDSFLNDLEEVKNNYAGNYALVIGDRHYTGQTDDCRLAFMEFVRLSVLIDALGGSCYLEELPGQDVTIFGCDRRVATQEEINCIIEAYKVARAEHEKKVDAYLKRYGTSKVHSWTYWRDA